MANIPARPAPSYVDGQKATRPTTARTDTSPSTAPVKPTVLDVKDQVDKNQVRGQAWTNFADVAPAEAPPVAVVGGKVPRAPGESFPSWFRKEARRLLEQNTRHATITEKGELSQDLEQAAKTGAKVYSYTVPSPTRYPFQWFWDSCFHAIAWSHLDPKRAAEEVRSLLSAQDKDGFLPHVVFWDQAEVMTKVGPGAWQFLESKPWIVAAGIKTGARKPKTTAQIQPPLIAQTVEKILDQGKADPTFDGDAFLKESLPGLTRYYQWLQSTRSFDDDGLISIISPSESGLDFLRAFDPALNVKGHSAAELVGKMRWVQLMNKVHRYDSAKMAKADKFVVKDMLVNSIMLEGLDSLSRLAEKAGDTATADWAKATRAKGVKSLIAKAYDPEKGLFFNLNGRNEDRPARASVESLMPLILPDLPKDIADNLVKHLTSAEEFGLTGDEKGLPFGVPHMPLNDSEVLAKKDRKKEWETLGRNEDRTWIMTNWWLSKGLEQHGYHEQAELLRKQTIDLVEKSGNREFFDPKTGEGHGAEEFTWGTLILDMMPAEG